MTEYLKHLKDNKWLNRYVDLAEFVSMWSKDPRTKVGAVLVGRDRRNIAIGYNGFPPGVKDLAERMEDRPTKYFFTQHAERNVLDNAQFDCEGATLYVTMHPCADCAKSIVSKRIAAVACPPAPTEEPWAQSAKYARIILEEAGVKIIDLRKPY